MDTQSSTGVDGTHGARTQGSSLTSSPSSPLPGFVLRIVAIVLTFISAIVMGVAQESVAVIETDSSGQTVANLTGKVKSGYSSAFVYFMVINWIVLVYSIFSLAMTILIKGRPRTLAMLLPIADLVMVVLLFSSNGAAAAISVVADKGLMRYGWIKICYALHRFCRRVKASIVLSMFASVAYLLLVALEIIGL